MRYKEIYQYYEQCFDKHGDTPAGLAWQSAESMETRFKVMADLIREPNSSVLDLGCGTGRFYPYLSKRRPDCHYAGMDISRKMIAHVWKTYPELQSNLYCTDIIANPISPGAYDYVVMNGILTVKNDLSFDEMWVFAKDIIRAAWRGSSKGIAFNVMSKQVDWERDDLFHLPLDQCSEFVVSELSRRFVIRHDYPLYEYTIYVYK